MTSSRGSWVGALLSAVACARAAPTRPGAPVAAAAPPVAVAIREDWPAGRPLALVVVDGARHAVSGATAAPVYTPALPPHHASCIARIEVVRGAAARARFGPGAEGGVAVVTLNPGAARAPGAACPPAT